MKKLVSLILSMVMVIGFAPQASFAAPGGIGGLWELVNLTTEGENGTTVSEGDEIYFDDELTAKYKLTFPPDDGIIVDDGNDYIEEIVMPTNLVLSDSDGEHEISVDEDGTAIPYASIIINGNKATFKMTAEQKKQFLSFIEEGAEIDAEVYFICKLDEDAVGNKETVTLDISATKTVNITVGDNKPAPADTPPEIVSKDGVYYDGIIT